MLMSWISTASLPAAIPLFCGLLLAIGMTHSAAGQAGETTPDEARHEAAKGTFQVQLLPVELGEDSHVQGMSLDKEFSGDLQGKSRGMMLAVRTAQPGSAGYVAFEKVSGQLGDRHGSFVLQHSSTLNRGQPTQSITVVPDSGEGELVGLRGSMIIEIEGGNHSYVFRYSLPGQPRPRGPETPGP